MVLGLPLVLTTHTQLQFPLHMDSLVPLGSGSPHHSSWHGWIWFIPFFLARFGGFVGFEPLDWFPVVHYIHHTFPTPHALP